MGLVEMFCSNARVRIVALWAFLLGIFTFVPARASWVADGVPVCRASGDQFFVRAAPDGAGGCYVAWLDRRSGNDDIYLQRITASGDVAPGWPTDGLGVSAPSESKSQPRIVSDGSGGIIVVWADNRVGGNPFVIYAQRVTADARVADGWVADGVKVGPGLRGQWEPWVAPDGQGGAFVVWRDERNLSSTGTDIYANHVAPSGVIAADWPVEGIRISSGPYLEQFPEVHPDGVGGAFIMWGEYSYNSRDPTAKYFVQRIHPSGAVAEGWPPAGLKVSALIPNFAYNSTASMAPDGMGGSIVVWTQLVSSSGIYLCQCAFAQRINSVGQQVWASGGVNIGGGSWDGVNFPYSLDPRVIADGSGGAYVTWWQTSSPSHDAEVMAQRVDATGLLRWGAAGVIAGGGIESQRYPEIVPAPGGGVFISWQDARTWPLSGMDIYATRLSGSGAAESGWLPILGSVVSGAAGNQQAPAITADGTGGAIVAWQDNRGPDLDVYAARLGVDGPVPAILSLVDAQATEAGVVLSWFGIDAENLITNVERRTAKSGWETLGPATAQGPGSLRYEDRAVVAGSRYAYRLAYQSEGTAQVTAETWVDVPGLSLSLAGFRPNPARGRALVRLTLPNATPATLEALDVRGRIVGSRAVGSLGSGTHAVDLDPFGPLRPGIYWLRLTQAGQVLTAKGIVLP